MPSFRDRALALAEDYARAVAAKDGAYAERNMVVATLTVLAMKEGWRVGTGLHDPLDAAWEDDWRNIVYIDLPTGQVSWHVHDSQMDLFKSLPYYPDSWDGHSTPEKYRRLEALAVYFRDPEPDPDANVVDLAAARAEAKELTE